MSAITNSILENIYQGARGGAREGAIYGNYIVTKTLIVVGIGALAELGWRAAGRKPENPLFPEDCKLERFRDVPECRNSHFVEKSCLALFAIISATTICGTLIGAISGVAKSVFAKPHAK